MIDVINSISLVRRGHVWCTSCCIHLFSHRSVNSYMDDLYILCVVCEVDIKTCQTTFSNTFSSEEKNLI